MNPKTLILFFAILLTIHVNAQYQLKDFEGYHAAKINTNLLTAEKGSYTETQSKENRDYFWFTLGLGAGNRGIAMGAAGSYFYQKMIFSARILGNQEINFNTEPVISVSDVALLAGYMSKLGVGYSSVAAGISLVEIIDKGDPIRGSGSGGFFSLPDYYEDYSRTFGVPIEIQVFAAPLSFMGFGIYIFGNINSKKSFAGALFSLQFGRLK
jgi:hypothetical protein